MVNVGVTAYNIDNLGIKAFMKTAGKETTKTIVKGSDGQQAEAEGKEALKKEDKKS